MRQGARVDTKAAIFLSLFLQTGFGLNVLYSRAFMPGTSDNPALPSSAVSELVDRWSRGDEQALTALMPLIYEELKRLASRYMHQERNAFTLQSTALIHEAYLRLAGGVAPGMKTRAHFFALAARVMRRVLVDHARARQRVKRGGGATELPLDEAVTLSEDQATELLVMDDALRKLAEFDERKARVVELRYFSGLEVSEAALALGVSENTVIRDWRLARAWLQRELRTTARTSG